MRLLITVEGRSYEVEVETLPDSSESGELSEPDLDLPPPPIDTLPGDRICRSPIAGLIVSVAVVPGSVVRKDEPIATIEAMKMQTAIGASVCGVVESIHVAAGDSVRPGQIICVLS